MSAASNQRVAFVTGASRGIGAAIAVALARRGHAVAVGARNADACSATVAAVEAAGSTAIAVDCDITDPASVDAALDRTLATYGRLDVLVNNAGAIDPIGRIDAVSIDDWARGLQVNLVGHFVMTRAALAPLLASDRPVVVNLSSGAAHAPREGWSAYCSAKAGLAMFTRSLALEFPAIACYGLQPGVVDTEMQVRIRASGINEISRIPRERLAPVERPADHVAWLCVERPVDLVGQDLSVNDAALTARVATATGGGAA
jgi:NAD(P)-dependent dehydrogenase (short-subunit alcohol dehydrogenase family)